MLTRVNLLRLSDVSRNAFYEQNRAILEKNILDGMLALKAQMVNAKDGEKFSRLASPMDLCDCSSLIRGVLSSCPRSASSKSLLVEGKNNVLPNLK
jgi:hypothetical protein